MQRWLIAATLLLPVFAAQTNAEDKHTQNSPAKKNDIDPQLKAELEEIDGIRDRLGIKLFQGTIFENSTEGDGAQAQFLDIYRRIAKQQGPHVVQAISNRVDKPLLPRRQASNDVQLFNALIEAGRQLDLAAARRESVGSFEEANRMRRLGKKIRKLLPKIEAGTSVREANRRSD